MAKHFHCPVNGWDCPYFSEEDMHYCICTCPNPMEECEDFQFHWEGYEEEDYVDEHD